MTSPVRTRSTFSFGRGVSHVEELVASAKALGHDRIGLADRNSISGHVRFAKVCKQNGITPLFGAELKISLFCQNTRAEPLLAGWATVFVQNTNGARSLNSLLGKVSMGSDDVIPLPDLLNAQKGLLILTGNRSDGLLPRLVAHDPQMAKRIANELREAFKDRVYIEIERWDENHRQDSVESSLLDIALSPSAPLPIIATTPVWFATPEKLNAWTLSRAITLSKVVSLTQDGTLTVPNLLEAASPLPEPEILSRMFSDIPEALRNAKDIFARCAYAPVFRAPSLPSLTLFKEGTSPAESLRRACQEGLKKRLTEFKPYAPQKDYEERLEQELAIIERTGFPSYFLVVGKFVTWAKSHGIPVGPGRGSGVGSLAAWALGITEVDPLRHGLLFERFLNPERVSLPDFDIDFCERRREEVLAHVVETYGAEHVGAISTFSEIKPKTAIKDVARVLFHEDGNRLSFSEVNAITKLIPCGPKEPKDIDEALEHIPELKAAAAKDPRIEATLRLAKSITGLYRQAGLHAAGVVIADSPLLESAPLHPATGRKAGQLPQIGFDMEDCEALGFVKFDFLGLSTTTLLHEAELILESLGETKPDWANMDLDDPEIISAFARGDAFGVFQFESVGMRKALQEVKPTRFSDLVAINALFRPGPIKYIQEFANRKAGKVEFTYPSPAELTRPILEETYGIMVYQEQVMRIAQVCAGYSLGAADILRRAMGKKKPEEMETQRRVFLHGDGKDIPGALALGLSPEEAQRLFDDMEAFAGYGFNKSHAVAYSLLAWRSMWFKVKHPAVFFCALLNANRSNIEEIGRISQEMIASGLNLLRPDIELSGPEFRVEPKNGRLAIRFGLDGVRNVGDASEFTRARDTMALPNIPKLAELVARSFNARQIESLAAAGAFDRWSNNRRQACEGLLLRKATSAASEQSLLPVEPTHSWEDNLPPALLSLPDWEDRQTREHLATGANFGPHPILANKEILFAYGVRRLTSWLEYMRRKGIPTMRQIKLAVMVEDVSIRTKNNRILQLTGTEVSDRYEIIFYENRFTQDLDTLKLMADSAKRAGEPIVVNADLSFDPQVDKVTIRGSRLETMLEVSMAISGWFVAIKSAGARLPEPLSLPNSAPDNHTRHRLLVLTEHDQEDPVEMFPVNNTILADMMCRPGITVRRVTEEEYQKLLNLGVALNPHMAAA